RPRMMRQHENRHVVRRIVAPPAFPGIVRPGTAHGAEHVPAQDPGADVLHAARGELVVDAGRPARFAENVLPERTGGIKPFMQPRTADAQRVLQALPGSRAVPVERNGEGVHSNFAHPSLPCSKNSRAERGLIRYVIVRDEAKSTAGAQGCRSVARRRGVTACAYASEAGSRKARP